MEYIEWSDFEYSTVYTEAREMNFTAISIVNNYNDSVAVINGEEYPDYGSVEDYQCWASDALIELSDLKGEYAEFAALVEADDVGY